MDAVLRPGSYQLDVLSAPFAVAAVTFTLSCLYVALMRGAPALRAAWLVIASGILPFLVGSTLVGSTRDPEAATTLYRMCLAGIPMAATGVLLFELALANRLAQRRLLIGIAIATSLVIAVLTAFTPYIVAGVWKTPSGLLYARIGPLGFIHSFGLSLWIPIGIWECWRALQDETSALRRRQLKSSMVAFSASGFGIVDMFLGYGYGWFPVSWAFLTIGTILALRALVIDDLIRARSVDTRVPAAVVYTIAVGLAVWGVRWAVGTEIPPLVLVLLLIGVFLVLRTASLLLEALSTRREAIADTPLERMLEQYGARIQSLRTATEVGEATIETVNLAIGCEFVEFLLPSESDYSWIRLGGELVTEDATPDPLSLGWFLDNRGPVSRDELPARRLDDLREPIERLFAVHRAEVLMPFTNRDEIVGMLVCGPPRRRGGYRADEQRFLERLEAQVSAALVYARMHAQATRRVEVDKEVELAAAVQQAFVPGGDRFKYGRVTLSGLYTPATRCGGDWWSARKLDGGRVLVLIGDVTGHGVAAAMVTAAAKGCYDVALRLMGTKVDLVRLLELLDASVRRVGAGRFNMTCFATIIDPKRGTVTFANAGHVVPYVCHRRSDGRIDLQVLVARGNPLGAGERPIYTEASRDISPGDLLVWYTDGIVECRSRDGSQFGDRRMQRVLRKINASEDDPQAVRDRVARAALAFADGNPPDDDITLVVAKVA